MRLGCFSMTVNLVANEPPRILAVFILPVSTASADCLDRVTEAMKVLTGGIDLVISDPDGKPRCLYCGQLNEKKAVKCAECGGTF